MAKDTADSLRPHELQQNICSIDYTKAFDCMDYNKLWKILQEMGIPDHLTCLLRNLYAGQEVTVRTEQETIRSDQSLSCVRLFVTP